MGGVFLWHNIISYDYPFLILNTFALHIAYLASAGNEIKAPFNLFGHCIFL